MSRVVKFRVWTGTHWLKPYEMAKMLMVGEGPDNRGQFSYGNYEMSEYTGMKDKNGVEIYEGDIVVKDGYIWFDDGEPNYRGTVEWIYSQWQVVEHCINPNKNGISDGINIGLNDEGFDDDTNSDWEVIGNIYENPDLLTKQA